MITKRSSRRNVAFPFNYCHSLSLLGNAIFIVLPTNRLLLRFSPPARGWNVDFVMHAINCTLLLSLVRLFYYCSPIQRNCTACQTMIVCHVEMILEQSDKPQSRNSTICNSIWSITCRCSAAVVGGAPLRKRNINTITFIFTPPPALLQWYFAL